MASEKVTFDVRPLRMTDGVFIPVKDAETRTLELRAMTSLGFSPAHVHTLTKLQRGDILVALRDGGGGFPVFLRGTNKVEALTNRNPNAESLVIGAYRIENADFGRTLEVLGMRASSD